MMALLGLGPRMLLCALSQLIFQTGAVAEYRLGAVAEIPLRMRKGKIQAKRQRLQAVAGLGGISDSSLAKVLAAVRLLPELLTDVTCRHDLKKAGEETWKSVGQTDEMELETGGTFTWFHSRPSAVLNFLLATCPAFSTFFASRLQAWPCTLTSPWRIVLYADEVTPGAVLKPLNERKCWAWYFSFLEFGREYVAREELWLPFGILRSGITKTIKGGVSAVARCVVRSFFGNSGASACDDFCDNGVVLAPEGQHTLFFARVSNFIADDEALTRIYDVRGASSLLPCLECKNVVPDLTDVSGQDYFVNLSCSDTSRFDATSDQDMWDRVDAIQEAHAMWQRKEIFKYEFERKEKCLGVKWNPDGLLADHSSRRHFKPAAAITHDVQHVLFANGTVATECYALLAAFKTKLGIGWSELAGILGAAWSWPAHRRADASRLHKMFEGPRYNSSDAAGKFKGQASEVLGVYTLIRHIVETHVAPNPDRMASMHKEVASFRALCRVADVVRTYKAGDSTAELRFRDLVEDHMNKFGLAYNDDEATNARPKHHKTLHIPRQTARDEMMLDCWVTERKNGIAKKCFEHVCNTAGFEKSALIRMLAQQVRTLTQPHSLGEYLLPPMVDAPELALDYGLGTAMVSKGMVWRSTPLASGDLIDIDGVIGQVVACLSLDDTPFLLLELFDQVAQVVVSALGARLDRVLSGAPLCC